MTSLIFAHGRSGSSELLRSIADAENLENFSQVGWEPFKKGQTEKYAYHDEIGDTAGLDHYIRHLSKLVVVKHLWNHLTEPMNRTLLNNPVFDRCVFLYRKSVFDAVFSRLVAQKTKSWRFRKSHKKIGKIEPSYLEQDIQKLLNEQFQYSQMLIQSAETKINICIVNYEELYGFSGGPDNQINTVTDIYQTLGFNLNRADIESLTTKWFSLDNKYNNDDYYREIVKNYDQLISTFGHKNKFYEDNPQKAPEVLYAEALERG